MIITRAPLRMSFFGGSSDYEDFYSQHGSFLISATIDKYAYISGRFRPIISGNQNIISHEKVGSIDEIKNPLLRETIKKHNVSRRTLDVHLFSDVAARTGLGASSSCCCALVHALGRLHENSFSKREIAKKSIEIERKILKESGGIQDQIAASYGGFNSIEIKKDGFFQVRPLPISNDFKDYFAKCLCLIYVDTPRSGNEAADSHKNKDKTQILKYAREAYGFFAKEDTESIFDLIRHSWKEKKSISNKISNETIDTLEQDLLTKGVKALKLLGAGDRGFILCFSDPPIIKKIEKDFEERVLKFKFEDEGTQSKFETS